MTYQEKGFAIIRKLVEYTYEAYLIGGVVRDYLLKVPFVDIDITTSATPEQILELFPEADLTYQKLGVTTLKWDEDRFEITTFREESYDRPRHPEKIHFSKKLTSDVFRRDFTVNALAQTENGHIVDLVKGTRDVKKHLIRQIGSSKTKFKDDPLRILRGYQLMARFNFRFEKKTWNYLVNSQKGLRDVSQHHLTTELTKIFEAPYGQKALKHFVSYALERQLVGYERGLRIVSKRFKLLTTVEKFAIIYLLSGGIPKDTCFDKGTITKIKTLIRVAQALSEGLTPQLFLSYDLDVILSANKLNSLKDLKYRTTEKDIRIAQKNLPILSVSDLAFKGEDLVRLSGSTGPFIQQIMNKILSKVLNHTLSNDFNSIKEFAEKELLIKDQPALPVQPVEVTDLVDESTPVEEFPLDVDEIVEQTPDNQKETNQKVTLSHSSEVYLSKIKEKISKFQERGKK